MAKASRVQVFLLALLVTALWGFNFIVIKVGVSSIPPLFLAGLRFAFTALPALLFVKKPDTSWVLIAAYGLFLGVGEFGFLFTAIKVGAPAGLSSIILQSQAFFTAILAVVFLKDRIGLPSIAGMLISAGGLAVLAIDQSGGAVITVVPLLMLLAGAFFWAAANVTARKIGKTNALGLMVWSSIFSPLPLFALSLVFEGPQSMANALANLNPTAIGALAYLVILSTMLGYGLWNYLIAHHGVTHIAPFSLLVPIFGVSSAALFLGERFSLGQALASLLVIGGLLVHVFGSLAQQSRKQ